MTEDIKILGANGRLYDPLNLEPRDLEDIDFQLSITLPRIQRFAGQLTRSYSVAQHCLAMVEYFKGNKELQRAAISHEVFEGLGIGDMPSPIKKRIPIIVEAEKRALKLFAEMYDVDYKLYSSKEFKEADIGLLITEAKALCPKSDFDWNIYGEAKGDLYKIDANEHVIRADFVLTWDDLFNN